MTEVEISHYEKTAFKNAFFFFFWKIQQQGKKKILYRCHCESVSQWFFCTTNFLKFSFYMTWQYDYMGTDLHKFPRKENRIKIDTWMCILDVFFPLAWQQNILKSQTCSNVNFFHLTANIKLPEGSSPPPPNLQNCRREKKVLSFKNYYIIKVLLRETLKPSCSTWAAKWTAEEQ